MTKEELKKENELADKCHILLRISSAIETMCEWRGYFRGQGLWDDKQNEAWATAILGLRHDYSKRFNDILGR